jgi:hypothetical protein
MRAEKFRLRRGHTMDTIWTQAEFRVRNRVISEAGQRSLPGSELECQRFEAIRNCWECNLLIYRLKWPARQDSNLRPSPPEGDALSS